MRKDYGLTVNSSMYKFRVAVNYRIRDDETKS